MAAVSPLVIAIPLVLFMAGSGKKRRTRPPGDVTMGDPDIESEEPELEETEPYDPPLEEPVPGPGPSGWPVYDWPQGPKAHPIVVGDPQDPEVAAQLIQMEGDFASLGVDLSKISAYEVTRMRKAPGQPAAIPPREYWPRMAQTIREVFVPLRNEMGKPLIIRNGYRPADYNEAVDGAANSRHQWFEAIDIDVEGGTTADRRRLAELAAQLYLAVGDDLEMGFGVYGDNPKFPTNIHVDTGHRKRTWGNAKHWIDQVAGYAGGAIAGRRRRRYPARTWHTIAGHPAALASVLHASAHAAAVVPPVSRYGPSQARVQSRPGGLHSGGPGQRRVA